jgi:predicted PhzF superfamily epimerase YddE/YHI9
LGGGDRLGRHTYNHNGRYHVHLLFRSKAKRPDVKLITPSTAIRYKELDPAYKTRTHTHTNCQQGYNRTRTTVMTLTKSTKNQRRHRTTTFSGRSSPRVSHRTHTPSIELPIAGSATGGRPPLCIDHRCSHTNKQP